MDVFHEPSFIAPFLKRCPTVVTVHDLAYKFIPNGFNLRNRLYLNRLIKRSLKISDRIIAVSEHTKKDILQNYGIDERKVKVIYEGVDGSFRPINDPQEEIKRLLKTKYGITGNFILTVSLLSPRKNLVSLIKAFSILKKKALIDHQLVIAGRRGWLFKEIFKAAADNEYHRDIVFCGFVPHEDLVKFYNAADVFVYPSLYEGFGLPLLEAMSCNCPVVTSACSCIPEICSDAALLVNTPDSVGLADGIFRVLSDPALKNILINKGKIRASVFSWKRTAEETINTYSSLM
jgi:glycosyltransferase involved in cell wall biosynthesis